MVWDDLGPFRPYDGRVLVASSGACSGMKFTIRVISKLWQQSTRWKWLLADSGCSRNTSELCRVGFEELLQSLRTAARDGANCIGSGASLIAMFPR
jgi:hypothetical protein